MHRREVLLAGLSWPMCSLLGSGNAHAWAPAGPAVAFDADTVTALARDLAARKLRSLGRFDQDTQVRRLAGMLARKGYSAGLSYRVAREAVGEADGDPGSAEPGWAP